MLIQVQNKADNSCHFKDQKPIRGGGEIGVSRVRLDEARVLITISGNIRVTNSTLIADNYSNSLDVISSKDFASIIKRTVVKILHSFM